MTRFVALLALPFASLAAQQPREIARIVVSPSSRSMTAGDTLRLRAEARDAQGNVIPGVTFRYRLGSSARFEGRVDSLGLVTAGSTGILPVTVTATRAGAKPAFEVIEITAVPGPAAKVEVSPTAVKLVAGQKLRATGRAFSASGDKRADRVTWKSANPAVATVTEAGLITAVKAGSTTITANVGGIGSALSVTVAAGSLSSLAVTPDNVEARTGDVVRFAVTREGRSRQGRRPASRPPGASRPATAPIDADGAFVGYEAGRVHGHRVVRHAQRRRPPSRSPSATCAARCTLVGRLPRTRFSTEEVWLHPDGKHAYLGSGSGGDVLYALDISDPGQSGRHRLGHRPTRAASTT